MMAYIGKIHVKIDNVDYLAKITDDGMAVLPNGDEKKLTDEQSATVKEKLEEVKQALASTEPLTMPPKDEEKESPTVEAAEEKEPEAPVESEKPAEPAAQPEHKMLASEIPGKYEAENFKKQKKEKGKASTVVAIIFAILFVAETAAVGVGYAMGYVDVNIPGITSSANGGYIETSGGEVTNIQPAQ